MGEEGHVMLLLAGDLGCDLRVGRTFRTPQRGFWRQGLALRQGATIHMMLPGHAATRWAIGHKIHAAPGKELNTENLFAHPAPKPSATKSFQKMPSAGIGARKVSTY